MILVDTSVWIRYLANRSPYLEGLKALLVRREVVGHNLVYGELLMGYPGGRHRLLDDYGEMRQATSVPHKEVVDLVEKHRLHGLGVGWIDVHLLASAKLDGIKVWTADPRFHEMARDLGVAYSPT